MWNLENHLSWKICFHCLTDSACRIIQIKTHLHLWTMYMYLFYCMYNMYAFNYMQLKYNIKLCICTYPARLALTGRKFRTETVCSSSGPVCSGFILMAKWYSISCLYGKWVSPFANRPVNCQDKIGRGKGYRILRDFERQGRKSYTKKLW